MNAIHDLEQKHGITIAVEALGDDTVRAADQSKGKMTEIRHDRIEDCGTGGEAADAGLQFVKDQLERDLL